MIYQSNSLYTIAINYSYKWNHIFANNKSFGFDNPALKSYYINWVTTYTCVCIGCNSWTKTRKTRVNMKKKYFIYIEERGGESKTWWKRSSTLEDLVLLPSAVTQRAHQFNRKKCIEIASLWGQFCGANNNNYEKIFHKIYRSDLSVTVCHL